MGMTGIDRNIDNKESSMWMNYYTLKIEFTFLNNKSNLIVTDNNAEAILRQFAPVTRVETEELQLAA